MNDRIYKVDVVVHIDSYEEGELENVNNFDFECKSLEELLMLCCVESKEEFEFDEVNNNYFVDVLSDDDNYKATTKQIELWKRGEFTLYNTRYYVNPYDVLESKEL